MSRQFMIGIGISILLIILIIVYIYWYKGGAPMTIQRWALGQQGELRMVVQTTADPQTLRGKNVTVTIPELAKVFGGNTYSTTIATADTVAASGALSLMSVPNSVLVGVMPKGGSSPKDSLVLA